MTVFRFEDLIVWKKARIFVNDMYKKFKNCHDYGFKDQILRASVSIMNNIAEGYEKNSKREMRKYLSISKGSCGEVRSMLYIAQDIEYINQSDFSKFYDQTIELSKIIAGFSKSIKNSL